MLLKHADIYRVDGGHWSPSGHATVASKLRTLLEAADVIDGRFVRGRLTVL